MGVVRFLEPDHNKGSVDSLASAKKQSGGSLSILQQPQNGWVTAMQRSMGNQATGELISRMSPPRARRLPSIDPASWLPSSQGSPAAKRLGTTADGPEPRPTDDDRLRQL